MVFTLLFANLVRMIVVRHFDLHEYFILLVTGAIVFLSSIRMLGSIAFLVSDYLEAALQLTVLPDASHDYGPDYAQLCKDLAILNKSDMEFHREVYEELKKRSRELRKKNYEDDLADLGVMLVD